MIILLSILLVVSIVLNVVTTWYCYKLVKRFAEVEDTFEIFDSQMEEFKDHLKQIYELEMYYGDTTLEALIKHTKFITEAYGDLKQDYMLLSGEETDATSEEEQREPKRFEFTQTARN
jgi:hypothetical protein